MKVYVLANGRHGDKLVIGVYATLEKAMSHGKGQWIPYYGSLTSWHNDPDWGDVYDIKEYEVE